MAKSTYIFLKSSPFNIQKDSKLFLPEVLVQVNRKLFIVENTLCRLFNKGVCDFWISGSKDRREARVRVLFIILT